MSLVVKNGSNTLPRLSSGMPGPVSSNSTQTSPSRSALLMVRAPPSGIASTAFSIRLTKICESWFPSATTGGRSLSSLVTFTSLARLSNCSRPREVSIISFIFTSLSSVGGSFESPERCLTMSAILVMWNMMVSRLSFLKSSVSISLSIWRNEDTEVRGFPISCAMPAVSLPSEASFSEWAICSSNFFISVTSCMRPRSCMLPSASARGVEVIWKNPSLLPSLWWTSSCIILLSTMELCDAVPPYMSSSLMFLATFFPPSQSSRVLLTQTMFL